MTGTDAAPNRGHPLAQDPSTRYPSAQRLGLTEHLHGRTMADPYRWLEDPADPRTVTWATEQDRLAREVLDALPGRTGLARELDAALQHATTADLARAPVLIRREVEVGHGAHAVSRTVALTTDQLCFLAQYTGLDLEAVYTR